MFTFESEDEVVRLVNNTELSLADYIFWRDIGRAMHIAQKIQVGMCSVKTGKVGTVEAPFGGIKESGWGL